MVEQEANERRAVRKAQSAKQDSLKELVNGRCTDWVFETWSAFTLCKRAWLGTRGSRNLYEKMCELYEI